MLIGQISASVSESVANTHRRGETGGASAVTCLFFFFSFLFLFFFFFWDTKEYAFPSFFLRGYPVSDNVRQEAGDEKFGVEHACSDIWIFAV